ncbi:MAG: sigma-70 family RNA polymerase sigma factor [Tenericutes bacterium]|nr:sigma-70 family RNA polymerase sigma factor [Mycoplasmatota bacterium]
MEENDNELLYLISEHSEEAMDMLYNKYKYVINKIVNKYMKFTYINNKGVDKNDLSQEAMIAFENAIKSYNDTNEASFYTFATICIDRGLKTYLKRLDHDKNKILNESISFNFQTDNENDNDLLNYIIDEKYNPENSILHFENASELDYQIKDKLTHLESRIYELRTGGMNTDEIAIILELDPKIVYNALQRIKSKIKELLEI